MCLSANCFGFDAELIFNSDKVSICFYDNSDQNHYNIDGKMKGQGFKSFDEVLPVIEQEIQGEGA
jgi:hypothetical protein